MVSRIFNWVNEIETSCSIRYMKREPYKSLIFKYRRGNHNGPTIIFLDRGIKNTFKINCLQGRQRPNKLLASTKYEKNSLHLEKKRLQRCIN